MREHLADGPAVRRRLPLQDVVRRRVQKFFQDNGRLLEKRNSRQRLFGLRGLHNSLLTAFSCHPESPTLFVGVRDRGVCCNPSLSISRNPSAPVTLVPIYTAVAPRSGSRGSPFGVRRLDSAASRILRDAALLSLRPSCPPPLLTLDGGRTPTLFLEVCENRAL